VTTVLLVDDHPLFLDGVRAALSAESDLQVVGEAHDIAGALKQAATHHPDVVLMDLNLPDGSGVDATRELLHRHPAARVLVITMSDTDDAVIAAMRAGARGYVVKGTGRQELLHAIRTVAGGGAVFRSAVADRLGSWFSALPRIRAGSFPELTDREREVLKLLARGYDNPRISRTLVLSDKTIRNHVSTILASSTRTPAPTPSFGPDAPGWAGRTDRACPRPTRPGRRGLQLPPRGPSC